MWHLGLFEFRGATHLDPREILGGELTFLSFGNPMTQGGSLRASKVSVAISHGVTSTTHLISSCYAPRPRGELTLLPFGNPITQCVSLRRAAELSCGNLVRSDEHHSFNFELLRTSTKGRTDVSPPWNPHHSRYVIASEQSERGNLVNLIPGIAN